MAFLKLVKKEYGTLFLNEVGISLVYGEAKDVPDNVIETSYDIKRLIEEGVLKKVSEPSGPAVEKSEKKKKKEGRTGEVKTIPVKDESIVVLTEEEQVPEI